MRRESAAIAAAALIALAGIALADDDQAPADDPQKPHSKEDQEVADRVAAVRSMKWKGRVPFREIAREELEKILELSFKDEYGDGEATGEAFAALGLLPPGASWRDQMLAEKAAKVQAFYLAKSIGSYGDGRVYVLEGLEGRQRQGILAHELVHAIDDQHYDLERLVRKLGKTPSGHRPADRFGAFMATEEGVAQVVWRAIMAAGAPPPEQTDIFFRKAPWADALTRYRFGFGPRFVEAVRAAGGWEAVNALYADPPASSEQVIHPERFLGARDAPQEVTLPDLSKGRILQGEWSALRADSLGELGAAWMFGTAVGAGWDGDAYVVVKSDWDDQVISVWMSTWDEVEDASELATAATELPPALTWLPDGHCIVVEQREREVIVVTGILRRQIEPLRKLLWKKAKVKGSSGSGGAANDDGDYPEGLEKLVTRYSAKRGVAVIERVGERIDSFRTLQLDDRGRDAAKDLIKELRDRAKQKDAKVEDLGRGAFIEPTDDGGWLLQQYKSSNLSIGTAGSRERLEALAAFVEDLK